MDETATTTEMARRYGRSPCGERLVAAVPQGHWKTTTFIAGLRQSGLAPALAPGDVVVLDNLAAHKVDGVREAVAAGRGLDPLPAALQPRPQPDRA